MFLQSRNLKSSEIFFVLGLGYLACSLFTFFFIKNINLPTLVNFFYILIWSSSIAVIMLLFFEFKYLINIEDIIIAKSLAPTIGVFFSGDFSQENMPLKQKLINLFPIVILLLIIISKNPSLDNIKVFVFVLALYVVAQTFVRLLARNVKTTTIFTFGGVIIFLETIIFKAFTKEAALTFDFPLFYIIIVGVSLFFIQIGYLKGLKKLMPTSSTVVISSSVPISIIVHSVISSSKVNVVQVSLALLYIGIVYLTVMIRQKWISKQQPF